jgi:hypothetical protein
MIGRLVGPFSKHMEETLAVEALAAAAVAEAPEQKEGTLEEVLSRHRLAYSPLDCLLCGLDDECMPLHDVSIHVALVYVEAFFPFSVLE